MTSGNGSGRRASGTRSKKTRRTDVPSKYQDSTDPTVLCTQGVAKSKRDGQIISSISTAAASSSLRPRSSTRCDICMNVKSKQELFKTKTCSHPFCSRCIAKYAVTKIEQGYAKVNCPKPDCKSFVEREDCRDFISNKLFDKWEALICESEIPVSQKFYCPFKECSALLIHDSPGIVTASECPICHRLFCARCKVSWHADMNCVEFQGSVEHKDEKRKEKMVLRLVEKKKWKRCPKCMYVVEKSAGCDHIICRCKHEFCYRCGNRWEAIHKCVPT